MCGGETGVSSRDVLRTGVASVPPKPIIGVGAEVAFERANHLDRYILGTSICPLLAQSDKLPFAEGVTRWKICRFYHHINNYASSA